MNLYDVALPGYHASLTKDQIAELYHAGRLRRDHHCKPAATAKWRTIDEIFPLLKYESFAPSVPHRTERELAMPGIVTAGVLSVAAALVVFIYFSSNTKSPRVLEPAYTPAQVSSTPRTVYVQPPQRNPNAVVTYPNSSQSYQSNAALALVRAEQARLAREESQREHAAMAERMRAANQEADHGRQQAAGRNEIIPLDEYKTIDVGGLSTSVQIHDNDVTSFDAWIDGVHYHEVRKQKGISDDPSSETFLYSNGRASLYYVWEISGKLNYCLLRVRNK